jgi:oligopeptidase B
VRAQAYPSILATASLMDPLVPYWMPARWVARLRAHTTNDSVVLLSTNFVAGHAGPSGRINKLEDVAKIYAFILWACRSFSREREV